MTTLSLKARLKRYIASQKGFVAKGDIQRIVASETSYTPENAGRRLRELEEEGEIEVIYRKNHAFYKIKERLSAEESWEALSK